ncbi:MAG TPA: TonB-dependent receptor, partial [Gammaproteobacteria bacterium]
WQLRSSWDMTEHSELDLFARHVGELPAPEVPSYTVIDARFAWHLSDAVEIALKVDNLLDDEHAEDGGAASRAEFGRQAFLQLRWNYQ